MKSGRRVEEGGRKYEDWRESGRRRKKVRRLEGERKKEEVSLKAGRRV